MKSIGIPDKGIENLYLAKIKILMLLASFSGLLLALLFFPKVTSHISRFFGEQPLEIQNLLLAIISVAVIYCIILLFAKIILKLIRRKTIVDLLVLDDGFSKKVRVKSGMYKSKKLSTNALIGKQEVQNGYGIVFILMMMITFLVMVPIRSLQTMQAEDFVTYMGSPICDLLVEVMQGDELEKRNEELSNVLIKKKGDIDNFTELRRVRLQAVSSTDELVGIHVDIGASAGKGIVYIGGINPTMSNHIALSYLLADELGKEVGDMINIISNNQMYCMEICGIYQDVTSGGKTAKATYDFEGEASEKYTYQLELSKNVSVEEFSDDLKAVLGSGYSIKSMDSFLDQTLGRVTVRFSQAVYMIVIISVVITIFIVLLYMELRMARTSHTLAEKIAMGIPIKAICIQELYPMFMLGASCIL